MNDLQRTPIITFKDDEELNECVRWWKDRLFLHDWSITAHLVDEAFEDDERTREVAGLNKFQWLHQTSIISISRKQVEDGVAIEDSVIKVCAEKTLVHELLHLRMNWLSPPYSHEGNYYDAMEHQKLEQFARSLILAKYQLPANWFDNSSSKESAHE